MRLPATAHGRANVAADAGPRSRTAAAPLPRGPGPVHRLPGRPASRGRSTSRPPEEKRRGRTSDGTVLDQFADVGDWEPMHRPLIQVMAVIVSISLVVAGVGTVLEVCCSPLAERPRAARRACRGASLAVRLRRSDEQRRATATTRPPTTTRKRSTHGFDPAGWRRRGRRGAGRGRRRGVVVVVDVVASGWRDAGNATTRSPRAPGAGPRRPRGSGSGWPARRSWPAPGRRRWTGRGRRGRRSARWSRRVPPPRWADRRRPRRSTADGARRGRPTPARRSGRSSRAGRRSSPRRRRRRRCRCRRRRQLASWPPMPPRLDPLSR